MINEIFEHSKEKGEFVGMAFYNGNGIWYGIVEDHNDEYVQINCYDKYGRYDGLVTEKIQNIERIDTNDAHIMALKKIMLEKQKLSDIKVKSQIYDKLCNDNWQLISLKPYEGDLSVLVSVEINNDSFYPGFVKEINDDFLKLEMVGKYGNSERTCVFKVEDISSIRINDIECRRRLLLYLSKT